MTDNPKDGAGRSDSKLNKSSVKDGLMKMIVEDNDNKNDCNEEDVEDNGNKRIMR